MRRVRGERILAVVGASALLVLGFDGLTYAATGSSLLMGKVNTASGVTTIENTGTGAALKLTTASNTSPPFTTNAKGLVNNLYARRAASADSAKLAGTALNSGKLGGKTLTQIQAQISAIKGYRAWVLVRSNGTIASQSGGVNVAHPFGGGYCLTVDSGPIGLAFPVTYTPESTTYGIPGGGFTSTSSAIVEYGGACTTNSASGALVLTGERVGTTVSEGVDQGFVALIP